MQNTLPHHDIFRKVEKEQIPDFVPKPGISPMRRGRVNPAQKKDKTETNGCDVNNGFLSQKIAQPNNNNSNLLNIFDTASSYSSSIKNDAAKTCNSLATPAIFETNKIISSRNNSSTSEKLVDFTNLNSNSNRNQQSYSLFSQMGNNAVSQSDHPQLSNLSVSFNANKNCIMKNSSISNLLPHTSNREKNLELQVEVNWGSPFAGSPNTSANCEAHKQIFDLDAQNNLNNQLEMKSQAQNTYNQQAFNSLENPANNWPYPPGTLTERSSFVARESVLHPTQTGANSTLSSNPVPPPKPPRLSRAVDNRDSRTCSDSFSSVGQNPHSATISNVYSLDNEALVNNFLANLAPRKK